jgi:hypothetical protein
MTDSEEIKLAIQSVIKEMMDQVMDNALIKKPFMPDKHRAFKPLYAALVPDEIFKGSHFERKFVTPFGGVWEKLAIVAIQKGLGCGLRQHTIQGTVKAERLRRITERLNILEHGLEYRQSGQPRIKPNWNEELSYILEGNGEDIPVTVICDVYAEDTKSGEKYSFEIKAPLPNSDQTKVSKEKILKLYSMEPKKIDEAYFALPYNPYGQKENYRWTVPNRWFNMKEDKVVLIGDEFWEKIGGVGTYQAFINAVNEIGQEYKYRIYKEFLGIEPPTGTQDFTL